MSACSMVVSSVTVSISGDVDDDFAARFLGADFVIGVDDAVHGHDRVNHGFDEAAIHQSSRRLHGFLARQEDGPTVAGAQTGRAQHLVSESHNYGGDRGKTKLSIILTEVVFTNIFLG